MFVGQDPPSTPACVAASTCPWPSAAHTKAAGGRAAGGRAANSRQPAGAHTCEIVTDRWQRLDVIQHRLPPLHTLCRQALPAGVRNVGGPGAAAAVRCIRPRALGDMAWHGMAWHAALGWMGIAEWHQQPGSSSALQLAAVSAAAAAPAHLSATSCLTSSFSRATDSASSPRTPRATASCPASKSS